MNTITVLPLIENNAPRPVWSVMIPTYNCTSYLQETIDSVLQQDRGSDTMEIWVVDDCSSDNPQALVERLGKGRIQFYRQPKNVGQLNNFDTCLNMARGQFIHLLHGDDFVLPGFYEKLEQPLLNNDAIGAAFTGNLIIDKDSKTLLVSDVLAPAAGVLPDFLNLISGKQVIQTPSIVVRRSVYEALGAFNRDLSWLEDWEMWIRIACNYQFYYEPAPLAAYRLHNSSNTEDSLYTGRFVKDVLHCIRTYTSYLPVTGQAKRQLHHGAKQHYLVYAALQARQRFSPMILVRTWPLVYNLSSGYYFLKELARISARSLFTYLRLFSPKENH